MLAFFDGRMMTLLRPFPATLEEGGSLSDAPRLREVGTYYSRDEDGSRNRSSAIRI